jgi:hypothetical protein
MLWGKVMGFGGGLKLLTGGVRCVFIVLASHISSKQQFSDQIISS